ncbi:MAG: ATP-binding protein [Gemmatimonadales bacterium]
MSDLESRSGRQVDPPSRLRLCVRRATGQAASLEIVTLRIPNDIGWVEEAVDLIARHCLSGTSYSRRMLFNLRVVLAESLANAIICGNGEDPDKWVDVRAELGRESIKLEVTDEGPGFDPGGIPDPTVPGELDSSCGRGLFLIRCLVDDVRFNDRGNSICMTLRRA